MYQSNQINTLKKTSPAMGILLFLMIFVSPVLVLQFFGKEVFLWLQILYVLTMAIHYKKIKFCKSPIIIIYFIEPFITALFAQVSSMPDSYKTTAINLAIMSLPLYFVICYLNKRIRTTRDTVEIIIMALRAIVIVELIWIPIQIVLYRFLGFDINKFLFVDTFHMVDNASFIRSWVWYPSGLSWHSAVLAPLFVIGLLLWNNSLVRIAILIESFFCGNSTTLIGVGVCFLLLLLDYFVSDKIKVSKKKVITISALIFISIIALSVTDFGDNLKNVLISLWMRLFGINKDASTLAHFGYYSDYFTIIKTSNIYQIVFGYGVGCSGYTITSLYGRYADGATWAIESDYINILLSRGIVGFINYYLFLFYILIKGRKVDSRYGILMIVILIQGFGYNVQFDYLFLVEAILFVSIKNHINFFDIADNLNKKKRIK